MFFFFSLLFLRTSNPFHVSCFFIRLLCVIWIAIWFRFGHAGHRVVTSFSWYCTSYVWIILPESGEWWMIKFDLVKILAIDIVANNMDILWEMNGFIPRLNLHIFSIFGYCFSILLQYRMPSSFDADVSHHRNCECASWVLCRAAFVCFIIFLLRL